MSILTAALMIAAATGGVDETFVEPFLTCRASRVVEFSPNSELLLMGDGALINLSRKNLLNDFRQVDYATFHPNSRLLAMISNYNFVLHDIRLKKDLLNVKLGFLEGATTAIGKRSVFSPDGKWFVTTGFVDEPDHPKALFIFDLEKRKLAQTIPLGKTKYAGLEILPDRKRVLAVGEKLACIEISTGQVEWKRELPEYTRWFWCDPDGKSLFIRTARPGQNGEVLISSLEKNEKPRVVLSTRQIAIAVSSLDGKSVLALDSNGTLMRRKLPAGPIESVTAHDKDALSMAFTPDGKYVLTGGEDWRLRVWNAESLEPVCYLKPARAGIQNLRISPNGKYLAARVGSETYVWTMSSILALAKTDK